MAGIGSITNVNSNNSYRIPEGLRNVEANSQATRNSESGASMGVSRNEYGDEFLRSSIVETEDGAVYSKPREVEENKARVPGEEELPKIDSLVGYTASQVEQFYYQGRISRYDYDVKMEQKEEMLASNTVDNNSSDFGRVNEDTKEDAKETINQNAERVDVRKQDNAREDIQKADDSDRQDKADGRETYRNRKDEMSDIDSDARRRAESFNRQISAISNEQRGNEEFEIIESGNDPLATFRVVQNLNNLGSGVEGGTWNIA